MKALITGVGGFVGRHLLVHLRHEGDQVVGLGRPSDCVDLPADVTVMHADLTDRGSVEQVFRDVRPDAVYHLAAQSSTGESYLDPWATLGNNLRGQALARGYKDAFAYPGFVPAYIRPLFCTGQGPFRWVALSGDPQDIHTTEDALIERLLEIRRHGGGVDHGRIG